MSLGKRIDPKDSLSSLRSSPTAPEPPTPEPPAQPSAPGGSSAKTAVFLPREPRLSAGSLVLSKAVLDAIDLLISSVRNRKVLYEEWQFGTVDPQGKCVAANLYGPPGTGKTSCAEVVAHSLGRRIIEVSYAELESKYVGDTGKNICAAFESASQHGALLFFDEADSVLGRRMTSVTQAADHAVNVARAVMLKQLDAFDGVVIFATNLAKNFDTAFVRRISHHVHLPLPDLEGRRLLFARYIPEVVPGRENIDFLRLAISTQSFSGGDIRNATLLGLTRAVARQGTARRVTEDDLLGAIEDVLRAKADVGAQASNESS